MAIDIASPGANAAALKSALVVSMGNSLTGTMLSENGVDCSGATDATTALQAVYNAVPDNSNLIAPQGATIKLSSTINVSNRSGVRLISEHQRPKDNSAKPTIIWGASGGTAFSFFCCDQPGIEGFFFNGASGSGCPDSWLVFDGENGVGGGTKTPTQAKVSRSLFLADSGHTGYKAIQISPTANQNHEDYEISDCDFDGYGSNPTVRRATDGVTTISTTGLTSATATFVSGDAGKTIIVSCRIGSLTTTIASVTNGTTVVLTADWTLASQTGATIHIGNRVGSAIYQRGNNAFATRLINLAVQNFSIGLDLGGGSNGKISGLGGGFNDLGMALNGGWDLDRYDCEGDMRAVSIADVNRPNLITSMRMTIPAARADGFILLSAAGNLTIIGSFTDGTPAANSAMIWSGGASVTSVGNFYSPYDTGAFYVNELVSLHDNFSTGIKTIFKNLPTSDPHVVGQ